MKFKVGDKVVLKKGVHGNSPLVVKEFAYNPRTQSINYRVDGIWRKEYELSHYDQAEDPLATKILERNNKPVKMISGENLLNENDPIKPAHYNKGEIDLFESAYRTRPFNEFRAIMEFIAERYMKRDKHDRVEDINKSIETLTRLKEYEELESQKKC